MSIHTYTREAGHGGKSFSLAIEAAVLDEPFTVASHIETVITFESDLGGGQIVELNAAVAGFSVLGDLKDHRRLEVDRRTIELIDKSFTTGVGSQATITSDGLVLKVAIDGAADESALDAITDNRD